MKSGCEHWCHRASIECKPSSGINCAEQGFANTCHCCLPSSTSQRSLLQRIIKNCINRLKTCVATIASAFSAPFLYFYDNLSVAYVRYSYLPVLFFFPLYYSSQASMVMKCARDCKEEYNEWIAVLGTRLINLDATTSTSQNGSDNIELQVLPAIRTSTTPTEQERAAPNPIRVPPPYSASPSLPLVKPPPPVNVVKLKDAWCSYIDARTVEWKILTTTACVFIAASPTIFQMPYASDDPITRSLAFFSVCRALSGLVYGPIFPIYFRTKRAKSVHSAMLWVEDLEREQNSLFQWRWIMLSLPATSVTWALFSFVLAIFAYIWRTGAVNDPSDSSSTDNGRPPMSIDLALVLRIAITSITVVDIGCIVWIWRVLKGYNNRIWKDDDGGDAFPMTPTPH